MNWTLCFCYPLIIGWEESDANYESVAHAGKLMSTQGQKKEKGKTGQQQKLHEKLRHRYYVYIVTMCPK